MLETGDAGLSEAMKDPLIRLAMAIMVQAVRDARDGRVNARAWLLSGEAVPFFDALDIDRTMVVVWLKERSKDKPNDQ